MSSRLLAIQVEDVNGDPVPNAAIVLTDVGSSLRTVLTGTTHQGSATEPSKLVFDLGTATSLTIELAAPNFFGYTLNLKHDPGADTFEVNARSPIWGLFTTDTLTQFNVLLRLVARRVRQAPRTVASTPARDVAPPVVDDPGGVWLDASRVIVGLFESKASSFPAVLGRDILGNPDANNWERFRATASDVDNKQADGGNAFEWLEYGDPSGFKFRVAIWIVNRAGARTDGRLDIHFFFCPRTDIPFYSPADVYPYKRKRVGTDIVQPYSTLAYKYLSAGGSGSDLGIAYQAIASRKSHVVVMPLNAYGFFGPLLCRRGLHRLAREVAAYVSDNTRNTPAPTSTFSAGSRQTVNRIAVSGYSAGAPDTLQLFRRATIAELADAYRSAKGDVQAQDFAKRLGALNQSLWQSPVADFDRKWTEFYSVDGFYGSDSHQAFPGEFATWFAGDPERILRVYATAGRMKSAADVVTNKLADVFRGETPPTPVVRASDASFKAEEWHRSDGRATLAWFSESYMTFTGVPFMPTTDAHHTIPRVVFSHALAQSSLQQL